MPRRLLCLCSLILVAASAAVAQLAVREGESASVLGEIVIEGNTKTERWLVEEVIGFAPGDPFDLMAFDRAWDRLEDCGYFAFVDLDTEEADGEVTLYVTVEEEKTTRYTPYVRYDRRHKYLLGAALRDVNLRGQGEVLELQAIAYRIQRGHVTWTKPWLARREGLSLTVDALWEQGPFVWRPFDYARWQATADLRQQLTGALYAEIGGGYESFDQQDAYSWHIPRDEVGHPEGRRDTWVMRAGLGVDTRDNPFYPERGIHARYRIAYRTGGDVDGQTDHLLDAAAFVPLPGAPILALHAHGRHIDDAQFPEYVLRWGGPQTVRGAPYARREGEVAYLATAEVRWPLVMMPVAVTGEQVGLGVHAFTDVGDAIFDRGPDDTFGRALVSYGAGVHVNLLTWQLRFEAAKERDGDWTFEFMDVFNF
jgi:outer membrane protein assembly factor BamA